MGMMIRLSTQVCSEDWERAHTVLSTFLAYDKPLKWWLLLLEWVLMVREAVLPAFHVGWKLEQWGRDRAGVRPSARKKKKGRHQSALKDCVGKARREHQMTLQNLGIMHTKVWLWPPTALRFFRRQLLQMPFTSQSLRTLSKASPVLSREEQLAGPSPWEAETRVNLVSPYQLSICSPECSGARLPEFALWCPWWLSCESTAKLPNFSMPRFSRLQNGVKIPPTSQGCHEH